MNSATCQKEAFPLAGLLSIVMVEAANLLSKLDIGNAWNLSKPDIHRALYLAKPNIRNLIKPNMLSRIAGGEILSNPKVFSAAEKVIFLTFIDGVEGFSNITTRGSEGFSIITTREGKEFSESIKKGSISNATLWNGDQPDRDFCRMQKSILEQNQQVTELQGNRVTIRYSVQPSGVSCFVFRRLRLISPCKAETTNCPVVSPSSFNSSIAFATSCGTRAAIVCDFALTDFVAMYELLRVRCSTVWHKGKECKRLTCSTPYPNLVFNTSAIGKEQEEQKITKPAGATNTDGPLTTNVNHSNEAAMQNHTTPLTGRNSLTPNKFTWRFLAISRTDRSAKPCSLSVVASTEREARKVLAPHFILSLSARLPVQGVNHV